MEIHIEIVLRTCITRINEMHSVLYQRGFVFLVLLFMPDVIFSAKQLTEIYSVCSNWYGYVYIEHGIE